MVLLSVSGSGDVIMYFLKVCSYFVRSKQQLMRFLIQDLSAKVHFCLDLHGSSSPFDNQQR